MKVLIDGVQYKPAPKKLENQSKLLEALDVEFDSDAGDSLTVRQYLQTLLTTLWDEQEGFSGKRPFGNSGWDYELYASLIKAGFIGGALDSDGCVWEFEDKPKAHAFVTDLIFAAFGSKG